MATPAADSMNRSNGALNQIGLLAAGERVLEIGRQCGLRALLQASGSHYLGIELSTAMVEAGNQPGRRLATVRRCLATPMRCRDAMDAALAVNTLWPTWRRCWTSWRRAAPGAGCAWPWRCQLHAQPAIRRRLPAA
jgi:hypothetical protein